MKRIYTGAGDAGETGLTSGGRVSKADPRVAAAGALDEAGSALGLARALSEDERVQALLLQAQEDVSAAAAEILTEAPGGPEARHAPRVTPRMAVELEHEIDSLSSEIGSPSGFVVPGGSPASAAIDVARATVRRAERAAVLVHEAGLLGNTEVMRYLNRLSDLIFMLARLEDRDSRSKGRAGRERNAPGSEV